MHLPLAQELSQVSVLTICTFHLPQQVGDVTPTSHPQTLRNPSQASQVSVLTICTFHLPQQVGDVTPTSHPQTLRNPSQTHRRLRPQPAGQMDLMLIAFASPCQVALHPAQALDRVINRPGIFKAQFAWHGANFASRTAAVKEKVQIVRTDTCPSLGQILPHLCQSSVNVRAENSDTYENLDRR